MMSAPPSKNRRLGQGANHYVIAANLGGLNNKAGVVPVAGSEGANVHNVYFPAAAETGYLGLFAFVFMLLRPLTVALICGWNNRGDPRGMASNTDWDVPSGADARRF
jgi:hypothetical protein